MEQLICCLSEVQLLLGVPTVHCLGKSLVWGSAQPLLSGAEVSWQRTKPVCNQTVEPFRRSWGHSSHRLNFREKIIPLKLEVLDDFKNLVRLDWKQPLVFQTLSEFQFFALHTLLEIDELLLISGECLINH